MEHIGGLTGPIKKMQLFGSFVQYTRGNRARSTRMIFTMVFLIAMTVTPFRFGKTASYKITTFHENNSETGNWNQNTLGQMTNTEQSSPNINVCWKNLLVPYSSSNFSNFFFWWKSLSCKKVPDYGEGSNHLAALGRNLLQAYLIL